MAKQRRARPRPATRSTSRPAPASQVGRSPQPKSLASPPPAPKRTGYLEAVSLYERGLQALQQRDYARAAEILRSVLAQYPDEKELHERVRLYLNVCERQAAPREATPQTVEERLYAATLALNAGTYPDALAHIEAAQREDPQNDHAHYMRAVVSALSGDSAAAVQHLQRAIELNPENRALARQDPDLESLRHVEGFRALLEPPAPPRVERRRPSRNRSR